MKTHPLVILLALFAPASPLLPASPEDPAVGLAFRAPRAPVVDGAVLDDAAWEAAQPLTAFWQTTPVEGAPASERTEVRVLFDKDTLYFGVVCYDREPDKIIVSESRRDSPLQETDSFQIVLDTFLDKQNGFVFGTNPAGIEYDGQISREGQEGDRQSRQQGGAGGGFNLNWDASWKVKARIGDYGWSAEFAIPLRTLRYAKGGEQIWGMNLQRNIRRRNENAFWSPLPRQYNLFRVSAAGTLRGLQAPAQRNLKLTPYLLGESVRRYGNEGSRGEDGDVGGDVKYSLTPSLTLDATLNTDFAQVEVDELQINLDRFNLFFPEKRPFFLENAGQFTAGSPGEVELFFSRRIGIGPSGQPIPILAGGRLSGKLAGSVNVGVLNMQARDVAGASTANNFTVVRLARDTANRSGFGAIFVNRIATGGSAPPGDHNQTYGIDGRLGIGRYGQLLGYAAKTHTPGITSSDHSFQLGGTYNAPAWELSGKYTEVGAGFNPEAGFLRRKDFRKPDFLVMHRRRMNGWLGLHEIRPHVSYRGFWKPDGFHETGFLHMDNHWEHKNSWEIHTGVNLTQEGLRQPFQIYPGVFVPAGSYDHAEAQVVFMTNQGAAVSFRSQANIGGFFGGQRVQLTPSLKARIGDRFNTDVRWERSDVELPGGSFVTNLLRLRLSYSFTTRLFVQALAQYNDFVDVSSLNLRLGWLQTANTGLFVVYNETRNTTGTRWAPSDRSLTVKFSRMFDLLD